MHTATLPSGEHVVVKVRRPAAAGLAGSDLDIVQRLAVRLQRGTRWGRSVGAVDLARGSLTAAILAVRVLVQVFRPGER